MQKAHHNKHWQNEPSIDTPVNAQNLNELDNSVDVIDDRVLELDVTKFPTSEAQSLIKDVTFDLQTGIMTKYFYNGSKEEINTGISKLNMNLRFDRENQILYIVNADGTEDPIDLSVFITNYEFDDSDTIAHNVSSNGHVTSVVKEGSIQEKHLQPNYLANIKVEVAKAEAASSIAITKADEATAAATTATTKAGEAYDYASAAATSAGAAATSAQNAAASENTAIAKAGEATTAATSASGSATAAANSATAAAGSEASAAESAESAGESATRAESSKTAAETAKTAAEDSAEDSEAWAVGQRGGVDVPSTDPTYQNSAKYWAERAKEVASVDIMTETTNGIGRPDGTSLMVDESGELSGYNRIEVDELPTEDIKRFPTVYAVYSGNDNIYAEYEYKPESENADENGWIKYGGTGTGGLNTVYDEETETLSFISTGGGTIIYENETLILGGM